MVPTAWPAAGEKSMAEPTIILEQRAVVRTVQTLVDDHMRERAVPLEAQERRAQPVAVRRLPRPRVALGHAHAVACFASFPTSVLRSPWRPVSKARTDTS